MELIEKGKAPISIGELKKTLSYCQRIKNWSPEPVQKGIHLLIKSLTQYNKEMQIVDGKLIWEPQALRFYGMFQEIVMMHIDEDDGIVAITQKEGSTPMISE